MSGVQRPAIIPDELHFGKLNVRHFGRLNVIHFDRPNLRHPRDGAVRQCTLRGFLRFGRERKPVRIQRKSCF